jgi:hypothetical protein
MSSSRPLLLRRLLRNGLLAVLLIACVAQQSVAQDKPRFRVIALAEHGGIHQPFVDAAKIWLAKFAAENNFTVDYIEDTAKINDEFLAQYQLFLQLNYPPYNWTDTAKAAFVKYIEQARAAGSDFITPRCSANSTGRRSGRGFGTSWEAFVSKTTSRRLFRERSLLKTKSTRP